MKSKAYVLFLLVTLGASFATQAQNFPDRPIRFVVNFPPGGSTDYTACFPA